MTVTAAAGDAVNAAVLILYLVAAYVRMKVARRVPALRRAYALSVPIACMFAGSYVWLMVVGESDVRLLALRVLQLVALCNVWIWPALVALQVRNQDELNLRATLLYHQTTDDLERATKDQSSAG